MRPVAPRIVGADEDSCYDEKFKAITFARIATDSGVGYVTRWRPNDEERERLSNGEDLFFISIGVLPAQQLHVGYPFGDIER